MKIKIWDRKSAIARAFKRLERIDTLKDDKGNTRVDLRISKNGRFAAKIGSVLIMFFEINEINNLEHAFGWPVKLKSQVIDFIRRGVAKYVMNCGDKKLMKKTISKMFGGL